MRSKQLLLPAIALLMVGLLGSCKKDMSSIMSPSDLSSARSSTKIFPSTLPTINLGVAGNFVILSKTGITDVYKSTVTGDIGASPITGAAILISCPEVKGTIYSVDAAGPACKVTNATMLTTAISNMQTAYTCLLYTSPSPRDGLLYRMPSS